VSRAFTFAFPIFGFFWFLLTLGLTVFSIYLFWLLATSTKRCADALERIAGSLPPASAAPPHTPPPAPPQDEQ
jgi:hypothetical protein